MSTSSPSAPKNPAATPERKRRVRGALTRYSVMAYITGVMLLLLCVEMIIKYIGYPIILDRPAADAPSWSTPPVLSTMVALSTWLCNVRATPARPSA